MRGKTQTGNGSIGRADAYTLRRTPVTPLLEEAYRKGRPVLNGLLGDPVSHGIEPDKAFIEKVAQASGDWRNWGYTNSFGHPKLRELIKELLFKGRRDVEIFIGAGVSGINDPLDRWIMSTSPSKGVVIPKASYILYFFDTEINGGKVQSVELTPYGQVDLNSLERAVNKDTCSVKIITTGNPLGVSTSESTLEGIIRIVKTKEERFGRPIYLLFDIMYEGFRNDGVELDPIETSKKLGREGPVFVVDSLSKKRIGAPGARLGWLAVYWPDISFPELRKKFMSEFQTLLLPRLSQVATPVQIGLSNALEQCCTDDEFRELMEQRNAERVLEIRRRVGRTLTGLSSMDGIIFPDCYYETPGDRGSGIAHERVSNSFYIIFGFEKDQMNGKTRRINPSPARFARWLIERENGLHVVGTTPFDCFLSPEYRGGEGDFMRDVALHDERVLNLFLTSVNAYAENLRRRE